MPSQAPSEDQSSSETSSDGADKDIWSILSELKTELRRFYDERQWYINGAVLLVSFLLQTVFQDDLEQILPATFSSIADFITSQAGIAILGIAIIALQAVELKWINTIGARVEGLWDEVESPQRMSTDGGSRQPRDSKGRFKSSDSGPSIIFALAIIAGGFLIGSQYGDTEAIVGALLAFFLLNITDSI